MAGLIPLMLKPAPARPSSTLQPIHKRQYSTGSIPTPKPKQPKRLSQPTPAPLPVLPYTHAEWRRAIVEIKREHAAGRYRVCASRCTEILDNLKDRQKIEPAYLIFLHFYGAASTEMCARPLPLNSPYRPGLLRQALSHYDRAAALIQAAEDSVAVKTRSSSVASSASSTHSSCHSPSGSVSSRAWSASAGLSSPTSSVCSFDDLAKQQQKESALQSAEPVPKRAKKVSFSLPAELDATEQQQQEQLPPPFRSPEPIIRPDSPTLGFEDDYFRVGAALRELPELPKPKTVEMELPLPAEAVHRFDDYQIDGHFVDIVDVGCCDDDDDDDAFLVERSVHRYNEHLSSLRTRLGSHSEHLKGALQGKPPRASEVLLRDRRHSSSSRSPDQDSSDDDFRLLDRRARIERLRKSGWQRKRFDARRYEELCDAVMAELS